MLGKSFRVVSGLPARYTDDEVCEWLLRRYVFVHLDSNRDKFNLLVYVVCGWAMHGRRQALGMGGEGPVGWRPAFIEK